MTEIAKPDVRRRVLKLPKAIGQAIGSDKSGALLVTAFAIAYSRYCYTGEDPEFTVLRHDPDGIVKALELRCPTNCSVSQLLAFVSRNLTVPEGAHWKTVENSQASGAPGNVQMPEALMPGRHRVAVWTAKDAGAAGSVPAGFDVTVSCENRSEILRVEWAADALRATVAINLLRAVRESLLDCESYPGRSVRTCGALRGEERRIFISSSRGPEGGGDRRESIAELFRRRSQQSLDAISLIPSGVGAAPVSYKALEGRAGGIARALTEKAIGAGDVVVVALPRSVSSVAALLAVAAVGAVYVPLDPQFPKAYFNQIIARLDPAVVLTTQDARDLAENLPAIFVDELADSQPLPVTQRANGADFAIFFSSGSTGVPKGVVHSETQFLNRLAWMWETYPFQAGEVACHRSPITVMPSAWEILGALLQGFPTAVASPEVGRDPARLSEFLCSAKVSRMTVLPSILERLLEQQTDLGHLKLVTIGGEIMPRDLVARFRERCPGAVLLEDLGCTETNTIWHDVLCGEGSDKADGGHPIANMSAYVLDRWGEPARRGMIGQLAAAGPSLATRYLGDEALTSTKFVPNEIDPEIGERVFRTGDLVYRTPENALKMIGRADFQMKIRGMTVDPSEIEAVLSTVKGVTACAAVAVPAPKEGGELVLFAEVAEQAQLSEQPLRDLFASRLPDFMVPHRIVFLDAMPRTRSGKVDRRAIAEIAAAAPPSAPVAGSTLKATIRSALGAILNRSLGAPDDAMTFARLGLDSARTVTLAQKLSQLLGREVRATTLFEHHTVRTLAAHLEEGAEKDVSPQRPSRPASADIAVIGMAGRFPGAADVDALWKVIIDGSDTTAEVPKARWDSETLYDPDIAAQGRSVSKWGAFLPEIDTFDAEFFRMAPSDARLLDPQQRVGLEVAWQTFEDAGYVESGLGGTTTGIYVGARSAGWELYLERLGISQGRARLLGSDPSLLASRISARLNLSGPSLTVDTACSSSLVALHLACEALRHGQCDQALAGGVYLALGPDIFVGSSRLGVLSPTGRCRPFDARADGFVQGEGAAFLLLKRLDDALNCGDNIHAVIKGTALDSSGDTNGIGAPSLQSQVRVQQAVHATFDIDPASIGLIEAHGTGTQLGDQIEIEALSRTYAAAQDCSVGSLKANIGHLTAAAGIAGAVKAILCLKHNYRPRAVDFGAVSPDLHLERTPFRIDTTGSGWSRPENGRRRAAVNSFGFGGANVHCILEEAPDPAPVEPDRPELILISGLTPDAVQAQAGALSKALRTAQPPLGLTDISFTLLTGREAGPQRIWFVAKTLDDLLHKLDKADVAACEPQPAGTMAETEREALYAAAEGSEDDRAAALSALARAVGLLDPKRLFGMVRPRRISLPGTQFQKQRFWPTGSVVPDMRASKADRAFSPGPEPATAPPANARHDVLLAVLSRLLGLPRETVRSSADLSKLGYDSITSVDLLSALQADHAITVDIRALTVNGGFEALCRSVEKELAAVETAPDRSRVPLTGMQRAFLFGKAASGWSCGSLAYHEFEVDELDPARLAAAWGAVVDRHPVLRTRFHGDGTQSIDRGPLPVADVAANLDKSELDARTEALRTKLLGHVFKLEAWPLHKLAVSSCKESGVCLVQLVVDTSLLDARSTDIVFHDWKAAYEGAGLGPEDTEFLAHLETIERRKSEPEIRAQHEFWLAKLAKCPGAPVLPKPETTPRDRWQRLSAVVPAEHWAPLRKTADQEAVFPASVLLACFMRALDCHTRPCTLVLTHSHRRPEGKGRCAGPFTTTGFVVQSEGCDTFDSHVQALNRQLSENLANRDVCATLAAAEVAQTGAMPDCSVVYSCDLRGREELAPAWLSGTGRTLIQTPGVSLECKAVVRGGDLHLCFDIDAQAVCERYAAAVLKQLVELVGAPRADRVPDLTPLQLGLLAGRMMPSRHLCREAVVYQEFDVARIDLAAMEASLDLLEQAEPHLRYVTQTGEARQKLTRRPTLLDYCDLCLLDPMERARRLGEIRSHLVSARTVDPQDPAFEIIVALLGPDLARIHIAADMTCLDGFGVLLLYRKLLATSEGVPASSDREASQGSFPAYRLEARVGGFQALRRAADRSSLTLDALIVALLIDALEAEDIPVRGINLAFPVDGRTGSSAPVAGDHTTIVPLPVQPSEPNLVSRAARVAARIAGASDAGGAVASYPLAYTGCLTDEPFDLPGARWGFGISLAPGTELDCYARHAGGALIVHWDIRKTFAPRQKMEAAHEAFRSRLEEIARGGALTSDTPAPASHAKGLAI